MNNRLVPISLFISKCAYDIVFYGNKQMSEILVATMCIFGSFKIVELLNTISFPKFMVHSNEQIKNDVSVHIVEQKTNVTNENVGSIIDVVLDVDTMINNSKRLCDV